MKVLNDTAAFFIELLNKGEAILAQIYNYISAQGNINFLATLGAFYLAYRAYKQSFKSLDLNLYLPVVAKNNSDLCNVLDAENDVRVALSLLYLSNDKSWGVREQYLNELRSAMHKVRDALRMHENSYDELSLVLNNSNINEKAKLEFNTYLYAKPHKIQGDVNRALREDFKKVIPDLRIEVTCEAIINQPDLVISKIKQNELFIFKEHNFEYTKSRYTCKGVNSMHTAQHFVERINN